MCLNPRTFIGKAGREVTVGCRTCEWCIEARARDWVGRICAETQHAVGSTFMTLTYGVNTAYGASDDVSGSAVLNYTHVQTWARKIRDAGYPFRYFLVGEYGEKRGRAHWHVICWWTKKVPPKPEHSVRKVAGGVKETCWSDPWWPHGNTQWGVVDGKSARYLCQYVTKSTPRGDSEPTDRFGLQTKTRMSLKPLIGARYFEEIARRRVEQRLPIRDRMYTVDGSVDPKTGKLWQYRLGDAPLRYVISTYLRLWREHYPGEDYPHSELVDRYVDDVCVLLPDRQGRTYPVERDRARKAKALPPPPKLHEFSPLPSYGVKRRASRPSEPPPSGYHQYFDEHVMGFVAAAGDGSPTLFWSAGKWRDTFANEAEWGVDRVRAMRQKASGRPGKSWAKKDAVAGLPVIPPAGDIDRSFYRPEERPLGPVPYRFDKRPRRESAQQRRERQDRAAYDAAMLDKTMGAIGEVFRQARQARRLRKRNE